MGPCGVVGDGRIMQSGIGSSLKKASSTSIGSRWPSRSESDSSSMEGAVENPFHGGSRPWQPTDAERDNDAPDVT